jgi:nucleotide-binding universal stress UspA family protein
LARGHDVNGAIVLADSTLTAGGHMSQQPVIASVDGSEKAARAIAVATAIAKLADADLNVMRVIDIPSERLLSHAEAIGLDDAVVSGRRQVETELANTVAGLSVGPGRRVTLEVLEASDVATAIVGHAVQRNGRVLVMATRAPRALERAIAGSVADRVVRESPLPVVLVPPGAAFLEGKTMRITRVLVPQDGSSLAFRCLEFLVELPYASDLEYVLVEVVSTTELRVEAELRLKASATWLRARGVKSVEVVVADASDAAAAIVGAVREVFPDIIAMSTRGKSGLGRLMLGSVAEGVIRSSELPVLLLTPRMLAQ